MISPQLTELIRHLSSHPEVPIPLSIIRAWLLEKRHQDEIHILKAPFPPDDVRGAIRQYKTIGDGREQKRITRIYVSDSLDSHWTRFVICKEMMHILDTEERRTFTSKQAVHVVENLNDFGFDLESIATRPKHEIADKFASISALLALAAHQEVRLELKAKFQKGEISLAETVEFLGIPPFWAQFVMASHFDEAEESILK